MTAALPPGRFGSIEMINDVITEFKEKPRGDGSLINAGYFVLRNAIFDYLAGDDTVWENEPLERLANQGELMGFQHNGFWKPMDTLRDKQQLEKLWLEGRAPWKTW